MKIRAAGFRKTSQEDDGLTPADSTNLVRCADAVIYYEAVTLYVLGSVA